MYRVFTQHDLIRELESHGVDDQRAQDVVQVTDSLEQALKYLGAKPGGGIEDASSWDEYFSLREKRYYYCNSETGANGWEVPDVVKFREWQLDAQMFEISMKAAKDAYGQLERTTSWEVPAEISERAIRIAAKLLGNIVDCGNTVEKYRTINLANPKIEKSVNEVPELLYMLITAGFVQRGSTASFPEDASLKVAKTLVSRLRRFEARRGHTGSAKEVDDTASSSGNASQSKFHGQPGFRYQQVIHHCSACDHPINDGSERLFTRAHDAPQGEYRYECTECPGVNLCEGCWDKYQQGMAVHAAGHRFRHHGPRMQRHGVYGEETDANPWGSQYGLGGTVGRGRDRLRERTGM